MRLDSFRNSEVKNMDSLIALMEEYGIEPPQVQEPASLATTTDNKKNKNKSDPTLRQQMLRWYNANPDMLELACNNALRITREKAEVNELLKYTSEFRRQPTSLSMQAENREVGDITFLEDFLFVNYAVMELVAKIVRPQAAKPKHLISEDLENITIFGLTNALVEASRCKKSPYMRFDYADFLDVQTC